MTETGAHFGVHYMTVSRIVKSFEWNKLRDEKNRVGLAMLECENRPCIPLHTEAFDRQSRIEKTKSDADSEC